MNKDQCQRWRSRAEECRTLADEMKDPYCSKTLRETATCYDRMADHVEQQPVVKEDETRLC